jgi:retron-type reverse transcriptase
MVGWIGLRPQTENLQTGGSQTSAYSQARWDVATIGIPCIKDRVIQMASVVVLESILEMDLPEEQYGYRRQRSAHDAIRQIHSMLNQGHRQVVDADLSG